MATTSEVDETQVEETQQITTFKELVCSNNQSNSERPIEVVAVNRIRCHYASSQLNNGVIPLIQETTFSIMAMG